MAPAFSKFPVAPLPNIPLSSGLKCTHIDCFALFSNLEDSEAHAVTAHAGVVATISCGIYESQLKNGDVVLYRILDNIEESDKSREQTAVTMSIPDGLDTKSGTNEGTAHLDTRDCGTAQLDLKFRRVPTPMQSKPPPSQITSEETPSSSPSVEEISSCSDGISLSRYPTLSSTSSISSFSDESCSNADLKLTRILSVVQEVENECRICWVNKTRTRPHLSYRCSTQTLTRNGWKDFKSNLRFPTGEICFFCLAPYGPPFDHTRPSPGTPRSPELCEYRDVLKELVYILYENQPLRKRIFARLGDTMPSTLSLYQRFIAKKKGGIFGAYNIIDAYLDIREEGEADQ